ncbi:MAG: hypothetical protein JWO49_1219 [Arthrobacter sp.]|nr:hypothetical protein [Arthrobacter sp.]MCU1548631.1 hypothetical protein [Arthrobacter sp.]
MIPGHAVSALISVLGYSVMPRETSLQPNSASARARPIDRDIADLDGDDPGGIPKLPDLRLSGMERERAR